MWISVMFVKKDILLNMLNISVRSELPWTYGICRVMDFNGNIKLKTRIGITYYTTFKFYIKLYDMFIKKTKK